MSDYRLKVEINRVVNDNNVENPRQAFCSIVKIIKMRHKQVDTQRIIKVAKELLT